MASFPRETVGEVTKCWLVLQARLRIQCLFFPAVNCVDRHMKADPDRCALIWEKDEPGDVERVTYR